MSRKRIKLKGAPSLQFKNVCPDFRSYIMNGGGMLIADLLNRDPTVQHQCNKIGTPQAIKEILTYLKEFCELRLDALREPTPGPAKKEEP